MNWIIAFPTVRPDMATERIQQWIDRRESPNCNPLIVHIGTNKDYLSAFDKLREACLPRCYDMTVRETPKWCTRSLASLILNEVRANQLSLMSNTGFIAAFDDIEPPQGWDDILAAQFDKARKERGHNKTALWVETGCRRYTHAFIELPIMTTDCLHALGDNVYHPAYTHHYSDGELALNLMQLGYLYDVRGDASIPHFKHWHHGLNPLYVRPQDEQDRRYSDQCSVWNRMVWKQRTNLSLKDRIEFVPAAFENIYSADHNNSDGPMVVRFKPLNGYSSPFDQNNTLHIYTPVYNGMPFIKRQAEVITKLRIPWRWHIADGLRLPTSCYQGGKIPDSAIAYAYDRDGVDRSMLRYKNAGTSTDGTVDYLRQLSYGFPHQIDVKAYIDLKPKSCTDALTSPEHRINEAIANIGAGLAFMIIEADEFWTREQIEMIHAMMTINSHINGMIFRCRQFVTPNLYAHGPSGQWGASNYDWRRVWRFFPTLHCKQYEHPIFVQAENQRKDLMRKHIHDRGATTSMGLMFNHYSYVRRSQAEWKAQFYGTENLVQEWENLQQNGKAGEPLSKYFPWMLPHSPDVVLKEAQDEDCWREAE
jgi:hypothetical protein